MHFFPMYHEMIQWMRYKGRSDDTEYNELVQDRLLEPSTVDSSADLAAKVRDRKERKENHKR